MEKLIITATCDSTMSYPSNPNNPTPRGLDAVGAEYVRCVEAGASICHLHGPYTVDEKIQPLLAGKQIVKVITVLDKLVNIVAK